jgi:hypothetical protein
MRFSASTTRTLRAKGLVRDMMSFMIFSSFSVQLSAFSSQQKHNASTDSRLLMGY